MTRVEATISSHLRGLRKLWRRIRQCKLFQGRTIKIMRSVKEIKMLFLNQNYCEFLKPKVGLNILPMLRVCHSRSFLFTLALKTKTCVMPLLVPALSKFSPSPIKFMVPYKLPMGSWSGVGASPITYRIWWEIVLWIWGMSKALTFRVESHSWQGLHWESIG